MTVRVNVAGADNFVLQEAISAYFLVPVLSVLIPLLILPPKLSSVKSVGTSR
jgi:hypothetical protein